LISGKRPKHFFGPVVVAPETSLQLVIIDGQQRLTTISLLMLALIHAIEAGEIAVSDGDLGKQLLEEYIFTGDSKAEKFKLKPVKNDARAYRQLLGDEGQFLEESNVTVNYRHFRQRLANAKYTADELWHKGISNLEVMLLSLEGHDDPQRIFESINSTGLALKESDKIRNLILMGLPNEQQTRLYEDFWNPLERNVDYKSDWFIRWYLTAKTARTPKESDVFEAFKDYLRTSKRPASEVVQELHEFSVFAYQLNRASTPYSGANNRLSRANLILGDVTLPFMMLILRDAKLGEIQEEDLQRVIEICEAFLLRRSISGVPSNALNKIFANLHAEIRKMRRGDEPFAEILIYNLLRRQNTTGRFPTDEEFISSLRARNIYKLPPRVRQYLFDYLENGASNDVRDIAEGISQGRLTIEHVMPQALTSAWREMLGEDADKTHTELVHTLGNLTVTGYNPTYSNSSFERKLNRENGISQSPYRLNDYIKKQKVWGRSQIEERTEELTGRALDLWPYPQSTYTPPVTALPTEPMGWEGSFTNRAIVSYAFEDVKESVSSWTDLLVNVLRLLNQEHRRDIQAFASDSPMLFTRSSLQDEKRAEKIYKVDDSLWVLASTSTRRKIELLRKLFERLNLDADDLVFTLRPSANVTVDSASGGKERNGEHPYEPLIKYLAEVTEIEGSAATLEESTELLSKFVSDAEPFMLERPREAIGNRSISEFFAETPADKITYVEALGLLTLSIESSRILGMEALHNQLINGQLKIVLEVLEGKNQTLGD